MEYVALARVIATIAHENQKDKGGNQYIQHPSKVASMVETENEKTVAWLHDVVEDTFIDIECLEILFPSVIVEAVDAITRRDNEKREDYLKRVKNNQIAMTVKIADLKHNSDITRIPNPTTKDINRINKYKREIEWLMN